ncbi:hypothetical protein QR685DRAFT_511403 [Neurospora intermedia]|uniref:PRISE-like Rossmann-fold domain-containing protein n=1 Tax=Neurospora intermedia TaxID=5142 RepID=A0ABR3DQP9_NEUIN
MASAIVLGATGIIGRELIKELSAHPSQWKSIHALSRSKKEDFGNPSVQQHHIDLLNSAQDMAKDLSAIRDLNAVEHVFFCAWLQKATEKENADVNGAMLQNFLDALEITGAVSNLKRIVLVTGCKQYGVHLGQAKVPMLESDPWLRDESKWPPNFYYRQQDILTAFCGKGSKHPEISWTVTYPNDVIGHASGNFMNLATDIAIYAAVNKELGRDLEFPGNETFYTKFDVFTSSKLHAQFCVWAVQEPKTANEGFNVFNGDVQSWQDLWPRVAKHFGMKVKADQFASPAPKDLANLVQLTEKAPQPVTMLAKELGLEGAKSIPPSQLEQRISLVKWSKTEEVKQAWNRLADREGLQKDALEKATWAFTDFILGRNYDVVGSMSKAREAGWTGYMDTWKSLSDTFGELEEARVIPKTH